MKLRVTGQTLNEGDSHSCLQGRRMPLPALNQKNMSPSLPTSPRFSLGSAMPAPVTTRCILLASGIPFDFHVPFQMTVMTDTLMELPQYTPPLPLTSLKAWMSMTLSMSTPFLGSSLWKGIRYQGCWFTCPTLIGGRKATQGGVAIFKWKVLNHSMNIRGRAIV